jgi:hypothetical protein
MTVGRYRLPLRRVAALEAIMRATEDKVAAVALVMHFTA